MKKDRDFQRIILIFRYLVFPIRCWRMSTKVMLLSAKYVERLASLCSQSSLRIPWGSVPPRDRTCVPLMKNQVQFKFS